MESELKIPLGNTQRLGNILYYLLGAYEMDLGEFHDTIGGLNVNINDLMTSFLEEQYFKIRLYKTMESKLPKLGFLRIIDAFPLMGAAPQAQLRALKLPMNVETIMTQQRILWP